MKPARSLLSLFLGAGMLAAQSDTPQPVLSIDVQKEAVSFAVSGPKGVFLGGVILSLSPQVAYYFQGLPPLLADFVVLGVGCAAGEYVVSTPLAAIPPGLPIYAQGLVADVAIQSTAVGMFVRSELAR